jgi:cbb3-type cytochrome oxidase subunit 3
MYIDFISDGPAYLFMLLFIFFFAYIIIIARKSSRTGTENKK